MIGVFSGDKSTTTVTGLSVALLLVVGLWIVFAPASGVAFGGVYVADAFGNFMKVLALIGSITAMILSVGQSRFEPVGRFEYPVLLVLATLGILLMISANNLISLYMALELQSLALYVVCAINRESLRSTEAGLKYFVLGALSSGMLLYGMSLVYGFTGNTGFTEIAQVYTGKNDFFYIPRCQLCSCVHNIGNGIAPAFTPGHRDSAEGTIIVTAILYFQKSAGPVIQGE